MPAPRLTARLSVSAASTVSVTTPNITTTRAFDQELATLVRELSPSEADVVHRRLRAMHTPATCEAEVQSVVACLSDAEARGLFARLQAEHASLLPSATDWPLTLTSFTHAESCHSCRLGGCVAKLAREEKEWVADAQQILLAADARGAADAKLAVAVPTWGEKSTFGFNVKATAGTQSALSAEVHAERCAANKTASPSADETAIALVNAAVARGCTVEGALSLVRAPEGGPRRCKNWWYNESKGRSRNPLVGAKRRLENLLPIEEARATFCCSNECGVQIGEQTCVLLKP